VLDITISEVNIAIERLVRIKLLEINETDGKWLDLSSGNTTSLKANVTSEALRKHQKQVMQLAIAALDKVPPHVRDQTSVTFAIDTTKISASARPSYLASGVQVRQISM
jgi:uncharacterized protein (TIGR02147 family)